MTDVKISRAEAFGITGGHTKTVRLPISSLGHSINLPVLVFKNPERLVVIRRDQTILSLSKI